jgi:hypothetical protein
MYKTGFIVSEKMKRVTILFLPEVSFVLTFFQSPRLVAESNTVLAKDGWSFIQKQLSFSFFLYVMFLFFSISIKWVNQWSDEEMRDQRKKSSLDM